MTSPANRSQNLDRRHSGQENATPMRAPIRMASADSTSTSFMAAKLTLEQTPTRAFLGMIGYVTIRRSGRTSARGLAVASTIASTI